MGDAPWRDLAEVQVRRHPRRSDAIRQVALLAIAAQRTVLEHGQRLQRAGLARLPVLPETGIPVQRRRKPQLIQRKAVDRVRCQCLRCGRQRRQAPMAEYVAPVRSEYLVRLALLGRDVPGFEQQAAIAALRIDALLAQRALDLRVARLGSRFVLAVPVHRLGADLFDQRLQRRQAGAAAQHQRRAARAQVGIQRRQRTVAPRVGGRARHPLTFLVRRVDVDRHHLVARLQRGLQGRIVLQPQVTTEP
ncbi:hypothetical protein G6F31_015662 [Rhizopus arrhizus]|nr:hypothetical protein G6F31_015662 [Rhizopus arrhizus]